MPAVERRLVETGRDRRRERPIRDAIERRFEGTGRWIVRHHRAWLLAFAVLAALPLSQLGGLELDTSSQGFLRDDDPVQARYEAFRETFGRDALLLVALRAEDALSPGVLAALSSLHTALEAEVPHLESVTSLKNAPSLVRGEGGGLVVRSLEREFPLVPGADPAAFRERVLDDPMLRGLLVSESAAQALLVLKTNAFSSVTGASVAGEGESSARTMITPEEDAEIVAAVRAVLAKHERDGLELELVGAPLVAIELQRAMRHDMIRLSVLSLGISMLLLALLFRRAPGVYIPIAVVSVAAGATMGTMAWIGTPVRAPTPDPPRLCSRRRSVRRPASPGGVLSSLRRRRECRKRRRRCVSPRGDADHPDRPHHDCGSALLSIRRAGADRRVRGLRTGRDRLRHALHLPADARAPRARAASTSARTPRTGALRSFPRRPRSLRHPCAPPDRWHRRGGPGARGSRYRPDPAVPRSLGLVPGGPRASRHRRGGGRGIPRADVTRSAGPQRRARGRDRPGALCRHPRLRVGRRAGWKSRARVPATCSRPWM